jgi:hypothetical protein
MCCCRMRKFTSEFYRAENHLRTLRACCFWNYYFAWVYTIKFDIFPLMFYNSLYLISHKQSSFFLLFSLLILVYWERDNHMRFTRIEVYLRYFNHFVKYFKDFLILLFVENIYFIFYVLLKWIFGWKVLRHLWDNILLPVIYIGGELFV